MPKPEEDKQRLHQNPSSEFKGVPVPPAGEYSENDCDRVFHIDAPDHPQTSLSNLIQELECPEESSVRAACTQRSKPGNRVAYYRDPFEEAVMRTLGRQTRDNSFAPRSHRGNVRRKALAVSTLMFVIGMLLVCRHVLSTTVQKTEASAKNDPPVIAVPTAGIEAGWHFVDEATNSTDDIWWTLDGQDYLGLWSEPNLDN